MKTKPDNGAVLLAALLALCGMKYHGGKYTPEEWTAKTGTDPRSVGRLVYISRSGLCVWTPEAETICQNHFARVHGNFAALGISS